MVPPVASTSLIPSKFSHFATTSPNNLNCPNVASTSLNPSKQIIFSQPPPPTTSIVPPLLPSPSTRRNFLISHQPPLVFAREPLQSPDGGVIVLTNSPLASNYNTVFEDQIRSVYYPSNHITIFNNISNVCTAYTHIGTIKIKRDICQ